MKTNTHIGVLLVLLLTFILSACGNSKLIKEYQMLYNDLLNYNNYGYKSSWDAVDNKGSSVINTKQGMLRLTKANDLAIFGDGFFKVRLENDLIGYIRGGKLPFSITQDGVIKISDYNFNEYELYDRVPLSGVPRFLYTKENKIFISFMDGENDEEVKINTYLVDPDLLTRYEGIVLTTKNNFNSTETGGPTVLAECLEDSNVDVIPTLIRMHFILETMKKSRLDYKEKSQVILMLINNLPIIDELTIIKIDLSSINEAILGDKAIKKGIDFVTTLDGQEVTFPVHEYNPFLREREFYALRKYLLLESCLPQLKIE